MHHAVVQARRQKTIYLMKNRWLKESLSFDKGKPLDEVDKRYTWEIDHARRVQAKRRVQRKEVAKARRLAARKEEMSGDEDIPNDTKTGDQHGPGSAALDKDRNDIDIGVTFDDASRKTQVGERSGHTQRAKGSRKQERSRRIAECGKQNLYSLGS